MCCTGDDQFRLDAGYVSAGVCEDPLAWDRWLAGVEGVGVAGQLGFDLGARVRA
jgi:hypothetical protein